VNRGPCGILRGLEARPLRISPERPHHWWRRRDSYPISFEMDWTMPSSFIACAMPDAGRVIRNPAVPDPGAGSAGCPVQPVHESLQGRTSWPRSTPRRCQVAVASDLRVHRMSPVIHFTLTGEGDHCDPSHQSNPRPQALHFSIYVRSCLFGFSPHATRAAGKTLGQLTVSLNAAPRSTVQRDPMSASPGSVA
jgi:hypothetical protein